MYIHPYYDDDPEKRGFNKDIYRVDYNVKLGMYGDNFNPIIYKITVLAEKRDAKDISIGEISKQ